jgi:hypothetical protein
MCAVPNMAVFCSSLTSWFPGMSLTYYYYYYYTITIILSAAAAAAVVGGWQTTFCSFI